MPNRKYSEADAILLSDGWHRIVEGSFASASLGDDRQPMASWREVISHIEYEVQAPWSSILAVRFPAGG